ncbi:hypothetical protein BT69DRAFT_1276796 [Atractiella rhizophila]|nr:hypothetical protein BT69DRAFT_1276796 [Atractiella rhizophila]
MSMVFNAAVFAGGIAVGAASTVLFSTRREKEIAPPAPPPVPSPAVAPLPSRASPAQTSAFEALTTFGGNPGPFHDLFVRQAYITSYDRVHRHPAWTAEHLTASSLLRTPAVSSPENVSSSSAAGDLIVGTGTQRAGSRESSFFREDPAVPELFRAKLADYAKSGYDRGHMVPAADAKRSQSAMDETFLLTNIAPQVGDGFNRHYWAWVEDFCRRLTGKFSDVYVFTIPLYLPRRDPDGKFRVTYEVIANSSTMPPTPNVSVPTHFAKVILANTPSVAGGKGGVAQVGLGLASIGAFVLPNQPIPDQTPLRAFEVPVEAVEKASGPKRKSFCDTTECNVVVRHFDDAAKKNDRKSLPPPSP